MMMMMMMMIVERVEHPKTYDEATDGVAGVAVAAVVVKGGVVTYWW
jgi:hypothetical protein